MYIYMHGYTGPREPCSVSGWLSFGEDPTSLGSLSVVVAVVVTKHLQVLNLLNPAKNLFDSWVHFIMRRLCVYLKLVITIKPNVP